MKVYPAPALAALASGSAIVSGALAIYATDPAFIWGGTGTLVIDGETYLGIDDRAIGQITGGGIGGSQQSVEITLSGVDPEALELLNEAGLQQAPAKLYRIIADGSGRTILDCRIYKRGRLDKVEVIEEIGGLAKVSISIETAARGAGRSGKRMRSDADQRMIDPLDGFFKHTSYAASKVIYNGGKKSSATG
ncbi:hypothetical protein [Sphingobium sp. WCS2017Hpa-17]|uniref:hypothetical protein n=1 Tax=Sphingobium sp. WCS2017Hpa-17 TaxID=3073638 RepID=UPI00288A0DF5|nr:hypothetical protein [Sphingobium sp. WCS2017Hpa-17]